MPVSSAANLWEQSLLAIGAGQSTTGLAGLPLSRASFAPTDFVPAELLADLQWIGGVVSASHWSASPVKREQAPSPQKQFCVKSGMAIQFFEEHGHFFFGLFVAVGSGGFQALFPGLAGCGGVALALVGLA